MELDPGIQSSSKSRTFWETHKIWKNLPHGFDKSADLLSKCQNHEEDFFQIMCATQKVWFLIEIENLFIKYSVCTSPIELKQMFQSSRQKTTTVWKHLK